jgi:hypothetical protein
MIRITIHLASIDAKCIEEALFTTQKTSIRRRRLPAEQRFG